MGDDRRILQCTRWLLASISHYVFGLKCLVPESLRLVRKAGWQENFTKRVKCPSLNPEILPVIKVCFCLGFFLLILMVVSTLKVNFALPSPEAYGPVHSTAVDVALRKRNSFLPQQKTLCGMSSNIKLRRVQLTMKTIFW
ncbi:hypothetical protein ACFL0O_09815 [Thermodesulfobacteriota bacterium]